MRALFALLLLAIGCVSSGSYRRDEPAIVSILTVTNQRNEDVTVYVLHAGIRGRRLGQVTSFGTGTFILTTADTPVASDVQFFAKSLVSGMMELSDPVGSERGATYQWKLAPGRGHEHLSVSYASR